MKPKKPSVENTAHTIPLLRSIKGILATRRKKDVSSDEDVTSSASDSSDSSEHDSEVEILECIEVI